MDDPKKAPLIVACRICRKELLLNEDSEKTRAARTDPRQQMRRHLREEHSPLDVYEHGRKAAWLMDMLAFNSPTDPKRYRDACIAMLDYGLEGFPGL